MATATLKPAGRKAPRKKSPIPNPQSQIDKTIVQHSDVPIDAVRFNPQNVRDLIGPAELGRLVASLKTSGLLAPIGVRTAGDESFTLIYGERRLRAAKVAGWTSIFASVYECGDVAAVLMMVEENLQRKKLNLIETARALKLLATPIEQGGAGLKQREIGARFGKKASWVSNTIRLLRLPDVWQERIVSREICRRKAMLLVPFADRPDVLERMDIHLRMQPANCRTVVQFEYRLRGVIADVDHKPAPSIPDDISEYHARNVRKSQLDKARGSAQKIMACPLSAEDLIAGKEVVVDAVSSSGILNKLPPPGDDGLYKPVEEEFHAVNGIVKMVAFVNHLSHLDQIKAAVALRRKELQQPKGA